MNATVIQLYEDSNVKEIITNKLYDYVKDDIAKQLLLLNAIVYESCQRTGFLEVDNDKTRLYAHIARVNPVLLSDVLIMDVMDKRLWKFINIVRNNPVIAKSCNVDLRGKMIIQW